MSYYQGSIHCTYAAQIIEGLKSIEGRQQNSKWDPLEKGDYVDLNILHKCEGNCGIELQVLKLRVEKVSSFFLFFRTKKNWKLRCFFEWINFLGFSIHNFKRDAYGWTSQNVDPWFYFRNGWFHLQKNIPGLWSDDRFWICCFVIKPGSAYY